MDLVVSLRGKRNLGERLTARATAEEAPGRPGALLPVLILVYYAPAYLSVLFSHYMIRPRMMEIYKDSQFLRNRWTLVLLYLGTVVLHHLYYFGFAYRG